MIKTAAIAPMRHGKRSTTLRSALRISAPLSLLVVAACTGAGERGGAQDVAGTVHVCSSCHGPGGRSDNSTFPRLAGQQKEYLVTQLKAFRDKTRADPHAHTYMWGMAAHLSDATINGLADYYSSQPPVAGISGNIADMAAGETIYREGIESQSVPACMSCHGEKAEGNDSFPRLAGQHQAYLERQLAAFVTLARANEIMHENTKNLNEAQIRQISAYLAAQ
jgi:cytochrome c553